MIGDLPEREREVILAGCRWIDRNEDALFALLADLVTCPSLSGEEGTHDDAETAVGRLWAYLDREADTAVLETQSILSGTDYVDSPRENVYAVFQGTGDNGFVCTSHMDIVPPGPKEAWPGGDPYTLAEGRVEYLGDETVALTVNGDRYERSIREKMARIWRLRDGGERDAFVGRGVYDNKASSICLVGSLLGLDAALAETGLALGGDLIHGHLVDEEVYQMGIKNMVGWGNGNDWLGEHYDSFDSFAGVVLEGSYGFVPVVGHRGLVWVTLHATGQSAHASTPELGHNAVLEMAKALAMTDAEPFVEAIRGPFVRDDLLGELTVVPGTTIVGGGVEAVDAQTGEVTRSGVNTVPDWCEITFDVRIPRWQDFPEGIDDITGTLCRTIEDHAAAATDDVRFEATVGEHDFFPPAALAPDADACRTHPLVRVARWAARDTVGYAPDIDVAPGVTDAAFLYHGTHMPTLVEYGPAGALSHEPLEYVERDQVIEGAKAMLKLAVRQLGVVE